ncbi:AAA family ATPase [Salinirubrum litoreum]|uniref:AAA family ATPase n=1 Tax=Salinirubrum litoreum TaxID=1126234 RepID=A0ABD5RA77_9EURY|nr:AAA family ATPase [Salinirubrum litoreum]
MLVVVCGLPGVGKTTVAEYAVDLLDAELLRTDVVRKELFPDPDYTDAEQSAVYDELLARARDRLVDGHPVVLDGTFHACEYRERALGVADATDSAGHLLRVVGDQSTVEDRIVDREDDASDADVRVHRHYRDLFEALERDHVTVDNSGDLDHTYDQIETAIGVEPAK